MRELAILNAGITLTSDRQRSCKDEENNSKIGNIPFGRRFERIRPLHRLVPTNIWFHDVIHIITEKQGIPVEVAITVQYVLQRKRIYSYVNDINTIEGGTHLAGFRRALTRTLKKYAEDNKMLEKAKVEIAGDDFREGLTAVISIKVAEPQFEGQTKTKLGNSEVMGAVDQAVGEALGYYLEEHPKEAKIIVDKVILAAQARHAARKASRIWYNASHR
ncbi:MAG: hypothetical protein ACLVEU_00535 [Bacteroides cellulosilyticus]